MMLAKMAAGHVIVMTSLLALCAAQQPRASVHFLFDYKSFVISTGNIRTFNDGLTL